MKGKKQNKKKYFTPSKRRKILVEAYCLKSISEQKSKRDKRLEKKWSSLKLRIENKNNR